MSPRRLPAFHSTGADPRLCAQIFGELVRPCRYLTDRSIEELAPSAGLTPADWEAVEDGRVPDCIEQMLLMASALQIGDSLLAPMLTLCARAYQEQPQSPAGWGLFRRPLAGLTHNRICSPRSQRGGESHQEA